MTAFVRVITATVCALAALALPACAIVAPSSLPLANAPALQRAGAAAGSSVVMYGPDSGIVARKLSTGYPNAIVTDARGDVFVASCGEACGGSGLGTIAEYGPRGTSTLRVLPGQDPVALAVDRTGTLWVANNASGLIEGYVAGATSPTTSIASELGISALTIDGSNRLIVANGLQNTISVYPPNATKPFAVIRAGLHEPRALLVSGTTLVVANCGRACSGNGAEPSITEYDVRSLQLERTRAGIAGVPWALASDRGTLYVSDNLGATAGRVLLYRARANAPTSTITEGINGPEGLCFDAQHHLYVANINSNAVTIYDPGSNAPQRTLLSGEAHPTSIALDRTGDLYVGNIGSQALSTVRKGTLPHA